MEEVEKTNGVLLAYAVEDAGDLANKLGGDEAFPITITVDEVSKVQFIAGGTVAEALRAYGVTVQENDYVEPALHEELEEFDEILIRRREKRTYTEDEALPYQTRYHHSPDVRPGEELVRVEGEEGRRVRTFAQYLYRGEVQGEELVDDQVEKAPVDKEILIGFKSKPVSMLDFGWTFDESNEPANYTNVLRGCRAAGYSAPSGAGTASGRPAMVGHVAVNPNVIPYGSKLFIQSSDGSFVYGYAIAADTGTALMNGTIDIDLFYASYEASAANGIKEVDIFVLE